VTLQQKESDLPCFGAFTQSCSSTRSPSGSSSARRRRLSYRRSDRKPCEQISRARMSPRAQRFTNGDSFTPPRCLLRVRSARRSSIFWSKCPQPSCRTWRCDRQSHLRQDRISSAKAAAMDIEFSQAHVRQQAISQPLGRLQPSVQESWKFARNEAPFNFSYKGETGVIPEGASCRILLDPTDEEVSEARRRFRIRRDRNTAANAGRRSSFSGGAVGGIPLPFIVHEAIESPHKP